MHRALCLGIGAGILCVSLAGCGSGGGGGGSAGPLLVTEVSYVDADGERVHEVGGGLIPRNARVRIEFNQPIAASTVSDPAVRVAPGPTSVPESGTFRVEGSVVTFDPTVLSTQWPRPMGFKPNTTYELVLSDGIGGVPAVRDVHGTVLSVKYKTTFTTASSFILETVRPRFVSAEWSTGLSTSPGTIVGAHVPMTFRFSEAIDPSSIGFSVSTPQAAVGDAFEARFRAGDPANVAAGIESVPVLGSAVLSPAYDAVTFTPTSWGDGPYPFTLAVLSGVKDLAGNTLENPTLLGPYTGDGFGSAVPRPLGETFVDTTDRDVATTTAEWGGGLHFGSLHGLPVTTRRCRIAAADLITAGTFGALGTYFPVVDPLVGAALQVAAPATRPFTSEGRRVLSAFPESEVGDSGAITSVAWGPDSNATFGAFYPDVVIRFGRLKGPATQLQGATISGNYENPPFVAYRGPYTVAQRANIGNETAPLAVPAGGAALQPLFAYTGFQDWPTLSSYFDWDRGGADPSDATLLLDVSVAEGDTWQQFRAWTILAVGPIGPRRFRSTYEADTPNPVNAPPVTPNPEPVICDTAFTIVRRTSVAQSRFYGPGPSDPAGNAYPAPHSRASTFGTSSRYGSAILQPASQQSGAVVVVEYQGATALDPAGDRDLIDTSQAYTPWTTVPSVCNGYPYLRWRLILRGDIATSTAPVVDSVAIPVLRGP